MRNRAAPPSDTGREGLIIALYAVGTIHPSILPDPARDRVRTRQPDAVRRPASRPGSGPPPGRAGADDGDKEIWTCGERVGCISVFIRAAKMACYDDPVRGLTMEAVVLGLLAHEENEYGE